MAERPILFSGPLVRAILDGRKTVTRRPMRPQPVGPVANTDLSPSSQVFAWHPTKPVVEGRVMPVGTHRFRLDPESQGVLVGGACPFGVPGDRLWVRETWQAWIRDTPEYDDWHVAPSIAEAREHHDAIEYQATTTSAGPWRPSIHMPRWASRLTLDVVSVRVERVQSITVADACAEGAGELLGPGHPMHGRVYEERGVWTGNERLDRDGPFAGAVEAFAVSWDSIYSGAQSWDANPWVWRVEFKIAEVRHAL